MKSNGDRGVVLPQSSSMLDQPKWDPLSRILEHHEVSIATIHSLQRGGEPLCLIRVMR